MLVNRRVEGSNRVGNTLGARIYLGIYNSVHHRITIKELAQGSDLSYDELNIN